MSAVLQEYRASRQALMSEDRSLRRDRANGTAREMLADDLVRKLRKEEATSLWNQDYADIPHPFPGMEFLTGIILL